ncbi:MAG TPA: EAL domain-containing protein [Sphingomicrobium sp.]|nr:EAL domain-containing protein [Sphingomicrobium sp.]
MERIFNCIFFQHDLRIVAIAAVLCVLASFTTFLIVEQARREPGRRRIIWLSAAAFVAGMGIWATHFIAMLAYRAEPVSAYNVERTVASIAVAIALSGAGWWLSLSTRRFSSLVASIVLGAGISTMHYVGMAAMVMPHRMVLDGGFVVASLVVSVLLSFAALYVRKWRVDRNAYILPWPASVLFTLAICGMHFTGMSSARMIPGSPEPIPGASIGGGGLIAAVSVIAFAILAIGLVTVIAERKIQRESAEQKGRLRRLADAAVEGLILTDGTIVADANRSLLDAVGHPDLERCPSTLAELFPALDTGQLPGRGAPIESELLSSTGERCPVELLARRFEDGSGMFILAVRDIRERKEAAARIAHLAYHDVLTGLPNRAVFADHLARTLEQTGKRRVALLCLDLDGFKAVNDLYGHPLGDELLIETSHRLRSAVGEQTLVARLGGDEFAIVQVGARQPGQSGHLADEIIAALNAPFELQGQSVRVGCSVGIAIYPTDASGASDLIKNADLALYRAKSEGGRLARFYEAEMDEAMRERRRMEAELKLALGRDEFSIDYQPLADLTMGEITGFEALLRWTHPRKGPISPDVFIPLAEECNYIDALGEWVLREACKEAASWQPPLRLSVNLSPLQFIPGNFVEIVHRILEETGMDPRRLDLEITEGLLIKEPEKAVATLQELKKLGIQISMDDFGTGYSSLSYFRMFPFDKVKIDRSFIQEMLDNPHARAIIRSVIGLGQGLEMPVIAEGVETAEQLDALKADGCTQVQGYLISRPGPIALFGGVVLNSPKNVTKSRERKRADAGRVARQEGLSLDRPASSGQQARQSNA